jgi:seryl-tRNA synthetase
MIDLGILRSNPDRVNESVRSKEPHYDSVKLLDLDISLRALRLEVEALRHQKNELAEQAKSGVTEAIRNQSIGLGKVLRVKEKQLNQMLDVFMAYYLECPNLPFDDVPVGDKSANTIIKTIGEKPTFSFIPQNHVSLGTSLGWLDFETGATLSGSQFALYKGDAVRLMYALSMFMLKINMKHGYEPIIPPYLVNKKSLEVSSNLPKFADQLYEIGKDNLYLIPTAEVPLTNLYGGAILDGETLPIRLTSWTSCFRREVGGYGATERGLIRIHQFEKVELYSITKPEDSHTEQERMLKCIEDILNQLGLHYRIVLLSTQETSFQSAKTYDIELWLAGQGEYYEVSSVSNCTDFQSRRGKIRYRPHASDTPQLVHTLNGSSLSLARLLVAIMETFQNKDKSITIPPVLKQGISLFE